MKKKKKIFIMKKKKKNFDAVGWKAYCSRLWSWALGAAGARAGGAGRTGAGRAGVRAAWAWPGRWARGLGARAGQDCALGAPDLIFKLVFDSVFFLSQ